MHTTLLPLAPYALLPCWGLAPHHAQGTSQHSGGTGGRRRQHNHSHPLSLPPPPPTSSFSGEGGGRGAGGGSTTTASPSPYLLRNISPQQLHPGPNQQLPGQPGPHGPITSAAAEVTAVATAAAAAAAAGVTAVATAAAAAAAVAGSDGPVQSGGDQQVRGVEHIAAQWGRSDQDEAKRTLNSSLAFNCCPTFPHTGCLVAPRPPPSPLLCRCQLRSTLQSLSDDSRQQTRVRRGQPHHRSVKVLLACKGEEGGAGGVRCQQMGLPGPAAPPQCEGASCLQV